MINLTCDCGRHYDYTAEIVQQGGTVRTGYTKNWIEEPLTTEIIFVCVCGIAHDERETWKERKR